MIREDTANGRASASASRSQYTAPVRHPAHGAFCRDVAYAYFRHRESAEYWRATPEGGSVRLHRIGCGAGRDVVFSGVETLGGRAAAWCAKKALLDNAHFLIRDGLPDAFVRSLKAALGCVAGPGKVPLYDHAVKGDLRAVRQLMERYDAFAPAPDAMIFSDEALSDPVAPLMLGGNAGKSRNALIVDGHVGGLRLDFGVWSNRKRWVLSADEERNSAHSRFSIANPGASETQVAAFDETYRTLASHALVAGVDDVVCIMDRLLGAYDPLLLAGDSLDEAAVEKLFGIYGPSRMFRAPARDRRRTARPRAAPSAA